MLYSTSIPMNCGRTHHSTKDREQAASHTPKVISNLCDQWEKLALGVFIHVYFCKISCAISRDASGCPRTIVIRTSRIRGFDCNPPYFILTRLKLKVGTVALQLNPNCILERHFDRHNRPKIAAYNKVAKISNIGT